MSIIAAVQQCVGARHFEEQDEGGGKGGGGKIG